MNGGGGKIEGRARCSESEKTHHSLTGKEQSPVRAPPHHQQLFVHTEQCGRDRLIRVDTRRNKEKEKFFTQFRCETCNDFLFVGHSNEHCRGRNRNNEKTQEGTTLINKQAPIASDIRWVSR